jgi:hypothetical protein
VLSNVKGIHSNYIITIFHSCCFNGHECTAEFSNVTVTASSYGKQEASVSGLGICLPIFMHFTGILTSPWA